jgi:hypothetical protein
MDIIGMILGKNRNKNVEETETGLRIGPKKEELSEEEKCARAKAALKKEERELEDLIRDSERRKAKYVLCYGRVYELLASQPGEFFSGDRVADHYASQDEAEDRFYRNFSPKSWWFGTYMDTTVYVQAMQISFYKNEGQYFFRVCVPETQT